MQPEDRHREAGLSIPDSPCTSSSVLSPTLQSACPWETCNPEQRIYLVHCPLAKGTAGHGCDQKMSAEPTRSAGWRRRRWPSARTHLHRAVSRAPVANFPSAKLDRVAAHAKTQGDDA